MTALVKFRALARTNFLPIGVILAAIGGFHEKVLRGKAIFPFDYESYHLPILHFIGHEALNGRFPVYDPYVYSGMPFLLNSQSALFYPIHLLFFGIFALCGTNPTHYMINLLGIFHFMLGGVFFYFLARHYGIRQWLSVAGSILYALNGHIVAQSQHLGVIETFAWLPLLFLLLKKFLRKPDMRIAVWIAVIASMLVLIGFLPLVAAAAATLGIFAATLSLRDTSNLGWKWARLAAAALIVVCLTSIVTIPLLTADQPMEKLSVHEPLPASALKTLVWPNIYKALDWTSYCGEGDPTVTYLYAGLLIPVFAFAGLFAAGRKSAEIVVTFAICILAAFTSFLSRIHSPSDSPSLIRPENFLCFTMLFGVLLALMGMEFLWTRCQAVVPIIAILSAVAILPMIRKPMTKPDVNVITATVLFALASLAVLAYRQNCLGAIGFLAAAHLFVVNLNCPMWAMRVKPGATTPDTIEFGNRDLLLSFKKSSEPYRVAVDFENLGGYWNAAWRIWQVECIGGFEPIRSQKYMDAVVRELSSWHTERLFNVTQLNSPLINLLNVKYLITRSDHPPNPLPPQWRKVREGFHEVYENMDFLSRYAVVPLESVKINRAAGTAAYCPGNQRAGRIDISATEPGHAEFLIHVSSPNAFLFISERNYRGWEITVDGQQVEPMTVNELLMGIPVVGGRHQVSLRFRIPNLGIILVVTSFGIFLMIGGFTADRLARRRRGPYVPEESRPQ